MAVYGAKPSKKSSGSQIHKIVLKQLLFCVAEILIKNM
jgi:hypothetical protein